MQICSLGGEWRSATAAQLNELITEFTRIRDDILSSSATVWFAVEDRFD